MFNHRKCPHCKKRLKKGLKYNLVVWHCPKCGYTIETNETKDGGFAFILPDGGTLIQYKIH